MSLRHFAYRKRLRRGVGQVSVIALLSAPQALAAPSPIVDRASPSPVSVIDKRQLESVPGNRDLKAVLDLHNRLRGEVGARPLRWNPALAANAQRYADVLARTGQVEHASRAGRENERENIIVGLKTGISPLQMVQAWVRERQYFRPGTFPDVCGGDWTRCGHFTQMIWPTTTDIGCGYATGRFDAFVCRYSPPGNKDGALVGPGATRPRLAGDICTNPGGLVIPCGNTPEEEQGGVVEDGGGGAIDTGKKEEEACVVDVKLHRPISITPDEEEVAEAEEVTPGATTLRNDDSDWHLGAEQPAGELPVMSLRTDVERNGNNPAENDLVKVIGLNPNGLTRVYLFAFPIDAEANRALATEVRPVANGRHASDDELGFFTSATKAAALPKPALPLLVPRQETLWVEGKLGGRYRMVIGKLKDAVNPGDVAYDRAGRKAVIKETVEDPFVCSNQATVTAAVIDIFQKKDSERLTAFDVYWGGRPHFRADIWPAGGAYRWGAPYKLGAAEHEMPGPAVNGEVASMDKDEEDAPGDTRAEVNGEEVKIGGNAKGGPAVKARIEGGFLMRRPNVPPVPGDPANRYPNRVSLGYTVNGAPLVRAEYLELILPRVDAPPVSDATGSPTGVESQVPYQIEDVFGRRIKAPSVADYLYLYGAGLKAWEALMLGVNAPGDSLVERGRKNDFLELVNVGVTVKGRPLNPVRFGTAQRSQAQVLPNRMTHGEFTDTLKLDLIKAGYDHNHRDYLWMAWSGLVRRTANGEFDADATRRAKDARRQDARARQEDIRKGEDVTAADGQRSSQGTVLSIPQDVVLQLRAASDRHDLLVFEGNVITLRPPFFFTDPGFPGFNPNAPRSPLNNVFYYTINFAPGRPASRFVGAGHHRP
jgi:hypothetical protein